VLSTISVFTTSEFLSSANASVENSAFALESQVESYAVSMATSGWVDTDGNGVNDAFVDVVGIVMPELATPFPDGLVGYLDTAFEQKSLGWREGLCVVTYAVGRTVDH
jgi:hypothetical protein